MKTVLITGVGKGIGRALCDKFIAEGYFVVGTYRGTKPDQDENLTVIELDLADPKSIERCVKEIGKSVKEIDIFINNAGVLLDDGQTELKPDLLRKTLEVNLVGTTDLTERLIDRISSSGHVLFISSEAGSLASTEDGISHYPGHYPAYKISKAALNMYGVTLAARLKARGTTVSLIHPGWVRTEMGGDDADISTEEVAKDIFKFAVSNPDTGGFWFKGERIEW